MVGGFVGWLVGRLVGFYRQNLVDSSFGDSCVIGID